MSDNSWKGETMKDIGVGKELALVHHLIKRWVENECQCDLGKVSMANGHILMYLRDHRDTDVYQKDFEEAFCITRSTASKIISLMETKGIVERCSVAGDARLKKIVLTELGEKMAQNIVDGRATMEKKMVDGFSEEELNQLFTYLQRIKDNINKGGV